MSSIRAQAANMLGLDLNDPADYDLANLLAAVFMYCYFTDLVDQINLWREAHGEEPFVLNGQNSALAQQVFSALTGQPIQQQERNLLSGAWNQLRGLFGSDEEEEETLDTEPEEQYNEEEEGDEEPSGPSRAGANGPDIGELNPIRYRGYYWDEETGYYFCQTRYYSPEWRRFINADVLFVAGENHDSALISSNMYAYCSNNPVMRIDPSGMYDLDLGLGAIAQGIWVLLFIALYNTILAEMVMAGLQKYGGLDEEVFIFAAVLYGEGGNTCSTEELTAMACTVRNRLPHKGFAGTTYYELLTRKDVIKGNTVKQYDAYEGSHYKSAMNYLSGRRVYSSGLASATNEGNMLKCLRIALMVYFDFQPDTSGGADTFFRKDITPYGNPTQVIMPSTWRHTFWIYP